jgi:hypothetical protein
MAEKRTFGVLSVRTVDEEELAACGFYPAELPARSEDQGTSAWPQIQTQHHSRQDSEVVDGEAGDVSWAEQAMVGITSGSAVSR